MVENRMVVDSEWAWLKHGEELTEEVVEEPGYHEMGTNVFIPEKDAFGYALAQCLNGSEEDQKEFKEMLVEWYFSGNWVKA